MEETNWTNVYDIIEIVEASVDFGPGGACIRKLEQTTDVETLIHNPFELLPFLPNTIYISSDLIRINYEVDSSIVDQICDDIDSVNWSQNHRDILGFDILDPNANIADKISEEIRIRGEYWRTSGPDDDSWFDVRDYYLLVIEMPIGKNIA